MKKKLNLSKKQKIIISCIIIAIILIAVSIIIVISQKGAGIIGKDNKGANGIGASGLTPDKVKAGVTIGGVTGTLEDLDTSDATAKPEDIAKGKTAYVNGVKIVGTREDPVIVDGVTIPKGFYYVGGTKSDGLVISDNQADENKYSKDKHSNQANIPADELVGNQFVWVPVENYSEFKRYPSYSSGFTQSISGYSEPAKQGSRYPTEESEYNAMMSSVKINKGFYVARFEAGKGTGADSGKVVSKKGVSVWNNIKWGDSMTNIGTTGAVAKAKGMYTNKDTHAVTSTLIYGTQWDAIMAWINPEYKTSNCERFHVVVDSAGVGNYMGNLGTCGSKDNYDVKNIYDLAGNAWEMTMEADTSKRIVRGGSHLTAGAGAPMSNRDNTYSVTNSDSSIRFPRSFIFIIVT